MSAVVEAESSGPGPSGTDGAAPAHTGSPRTRVLGILALVGVAAVLVLGLVITPADAVQGDAARLIYLHVPVAVCMYLAVGALGIGSIGWLRRRTEFWDHLAVAGAEVGLVFTALTLFTGMVWGRPVWGVYWVWDARLTTTALLLVLLTGYLALRGLPADPTARARGAAIVGLVVVLDLPVIHYSVEWWRTLHQGRTVATLDAQIDGLMLFTLFLGMVVGALVFTWLLVHRFRLAHLEARDEEQGLDRALQARRAEGAQP